MKLEWKSCLRAGATLFALFLLVHYWDHLAGLAGLALEVSAPLGLGCVIAYVLNIPMTFFERHLTFPTEPPLWKKLRRPVCLVLALVSLAVLLLLLVQMILPELISSVTLLLEQLPAALNEVERQLEVNFQLSQFFSGEGESYLGMDMDWESTISQLANWLATGLGGAVASITGVVNSLVSTTVTLCVGLVFSFYVLLGKERLGLQLRRLADTYLKHTFTERLRYVSSTLDRCLHKFIVGQCTEAVILGLLCILGMTIFRFPYAFMIGALVGFTALIPIVGAYLGAAVGALMIFTVDPLQSLFFLIFLVVLQQLEGNLIYPRVVGSSIGLPGIWVLAAVTVGGGVLGIGGMLLSVPITAAVYQLIRTDMRSRQSAPAQDGGEEAEP